MKKTSFGDFLKGLDFFGMPVNLSVDGQHKFRTKLGGVFCLIFALASLLYGSYRGYIMLARLETSFNQNTITNYYSQSDVISSIVLVEDAQGIVSKTWFNLAFGVFNDDLKEVPNFEQYFKLRVRNYAFTTLQTGVGEETPDAFKKSTS
jgi:hypothetical protein